MSGDLAFDLGHMRERLVPAHFEFAGHQPVGGIGGVILPEGAVGGIARRFEIATKGLADLIPSFSGLPWRQSVAAAMAPGPTTLSSASSIASSTRNPPNAMQCGPPLSIQARLQL